MSFWAVTSYFNPAGYRAPRRNYELFVRNLERQKVNLLTVELAFGQAKDTIRGNVHHLRSQSVLWQKERLLNHAFSVLPSNCDAVAWLDCDVLFEQDDWTLRTQRALEEYDVVQPYSGVYRLFPEHEKFTRQNPWGQPLLRERGVLASVLDGGETTNTSFGFAWAARREFLQRIGGLYERAILGGADYAFVNGLLCRPIQFGYEPLDRHIQQWAVAVGAAGAALGVVHGDIAHLYHGNLSRRRYMDRYEIARRHSYEPTTDIYRINHVFEWATFKPALHQAVREYFAGRQEDEPWLDESREDAKINLS